MVSLLNFLLNDTFQKFHYYHQEFNGYRIKNLKAMDDKFWLSVKRFMHVLLGLSAMPLNYIVYGALYLENG